MGLDHSLEGEEGDQGNQYASGDKPDLNLPGLQKDVLKAIHESGKPAVLVLMSGSALSVTWADKHIPAIVQCWYPGALGGRAVAEALFGEFSPQGKLPLTFYRSTEELPAFTDYSMANRTYRYMKNEALYPFGYGLSYTRFELLNPTISCGGTLPSSDDVTVAAEVANVGARFGAQTVQVYVKYLGKDANVGGYGAGSGNVPNHQLKGFRKTYSEPGKTERVGITLPLEAFALYDEDARLRVCEGAYRVFIGFSQPDGRSIALMGQAPASFDVVSEREIVF
jgi:beta-glucosidase